MSVISTLREVWDAFFGSEEPLPLPEQGSPDFPSPSMENVPTVYPTYEPDSTAIRSSSYEPYIGRPGYGTVYITFTKSPKAYPYPSVPESTYREFIDGGSSGQKFHALIKPYSIAVH
jgi:hypothetical protein